MTMTFAMAHPFLDQVYTDRCDVLAKTLVDNLPMEDIHTVVDLGCGPGKIGLSFEKMGKFVTYVDGREEHIQEIRSTGRIGVLHDAHDPTAMRSELVLCMGLLYHSADPQRILANCAKIAPRIVVETRVMDRDEPVCIIEDETSQRHDQSLTGWGSDHSPSWVEQALRNVGYSNIVDLSSLIPDIEASEIHTGHIYNWELMNSGTKHRDGYALRKLWMATQEQGEEWLT